MKVYHDSLSDVQKYIDNNPLVEIATYQPRFDTYMRHLNRFRSITSESKLLEIGIGTGWFPILCALKGINCKGLEISPSLVEVAKRYGLKNGVNPDIEVGNIEAYPLGRELYDGIVVSSVFEHVEYWRDALANVFRSLKPGGVMFFESTNKYSFVSGEYWMPLYGWLPNALRYRLRIASDGPDIMKLGIDFNQFTYSQLRREFQKVGFAQISDRIDLADDRFISSGFRKHIVSVSRNIRVARYAALLFADATRFVCVK